MYTAITPKLNSSFAFQLWKYEKELAAMDHTVKPVITISREFGCEGYPVANYLAEKLTNQDNHWMIFGRQFMEQSESANDLRERMMQQLRLMKRGTIEQMAESILAGKPTNFMLYKSLIDEINLLSERGNAIIVGAAAAWILRERPLALHVRMVGSREFRIRRLAKEFNLNLEDAARVMEEGSATRDQFIRDFVHLDFTDAHHFDLLIHNDKFNAEQISEMILQAFRYKFNKG